MTNDEIPTYENCDLDNPEEMFLWLFTGAAGVTGAPLIMPTDYYRALSKQMYDGGARLVAPPTIKWRPAAGNTISPMFAQGEWVAVDEPDEEQDEVARIVSELTPEIRKRTFEILKQKHGEE